MASRAKPGVEREIPISKRLRSFKRTKEVSPESTSGPSGHMVASGILEHETPTNKGLRSFKRTKYVSPESTSGPSGHPAATNR